MLPNGELSARQGGPQESGGDWFFRHVMDEHAVEAEIHRTGTQDVWNVMFPEAPIIDSALDRDSQEHSSSVFTFALPSDPSVLFSRFAFFKS